MPKILHRKKLRKYCWRRFNIIVYLPRLGFKSRPFDFIPAFRHNGAQQHDESSAKYLPSNQKQYSAQCGSQYCQDVLSLVEIFAEGGNFPACCRVPVGKQNILTLDTLLIKEN